jgi:hypothetical protein
MEAAENGSWSDATNALDRSMEWRVFAEWVVDPGPIIVRGELNKDPAQVCLAKHDQVVDALPPDRADQSFRIAVLPWRTGETRVRRLRQMPQEFVSTRKLLLLDSHKAAESAKEFAPPKRQK